MALLLNPHKKIVYSSFIGTAINPIHKNELPLNVYPNPFSETTTIQINNFQPNQKLVLTVTDLLGQTVLTQQIESATSVVERNGLNPGVYIYRIVNHEGVLNTGKLIMR